MKADVAGMATRERIDLENFIVFSLVYYLVLERNCSMISRDKRVRTEVVN